MRLVEGYREQEICEWGDSNMPGKQFLENIFEKIFGNIAPLNLGNTVFFGCCPYFSTCLFLKSGTPTPTKVTFMK